MISVKLFFFACARMSVTLLSYVQAQALRGASPPSTSSSTPQEVISTPSILQEIPQELPIEAWQNEMLTEINRLRTEQQLNPLCFNEKLMLSAKALSQDMAQLKTVSHVSMTGLDMIDRLATKGFVSWTALGENIAMGINTPVEVLQAWLQSEEHHRNILGGYQYIGLGVGYDDNGTPFWTQDLAASANEECWTSSSSSVSTTPT